MTSFFARDCKQNKANTILVFQDFLLFRYSFSAVAKSFHGHKVLTEEVLTKNTLVLISSIHQTYTVPCKKTRHFGSFPYKMVIFKGG